MTGHTKALVYKLNMDSLELNPMNPFINVSEPYILIVPSYDDPVINEAAEDFIESNDISLFKGVIGTGNLNFGQEYCFAARDIATNFNKPLLFKLEYSGTEHDVQKIIEILEKV